MAALPFSPPHPVPPIHPFRFTNPGTLLDAANGRRTGDADVGMTGPHDSVIGVRKELAIRRMTSGLPVRFQPAEHDGRLDGGCCEIDPATGRAVRSERIQRAGEASR